MKIERRLPGAPEAKKAGRTLPWSPMREHIPDTLISDSGPERKKMCSSYGSVCKTSTQAPTSMQHGKCRLIIITMVTLTRHQPTQGRQAGNVTAGPWD